MKIIRSKAELEIAVSGKRENGDKIGFVPTMGALHAGHLSLVKCAQEHSECIVTSIFVNPTQFAPHEDFNSYPRNESEDAEQLKNAGVDILFIPTEEMLYPDGHDSDVKAGKANEGLDTDFRPHFFHGVVNVVNRLFNIVKPDVAVFGEKDFQQLQIIKEMVSDLGSPIEIIGAPIVRDAHGLALASRNAYLSESERDIARMFNKTLKEVAITKDVEAAKNILLTIGFDKVDYIEMRWNRVLAAAWVGKTRLIDNVPLK